MSKIKITNNHANEIDELVTSTLSGELTEFGDISLAVFGNTAAGGKVGEYIYENRHRLSGWWRVVNFDGHPVADAEALTLLANEGHIVRNGVVVGYRRNPQANIMKKNGILNTVLNAVETVLQAQPCVTLSSNQIFTAIPHTLQRELTTIAGGFTMRACKNPASYVGTAAAMLAKRNPLTIIHDRHFLCPILNRYDDAFSMAV